MVMNVRSICQKDEKIPIPKFARKNAPAKAKPHSMTRTRALDEVNPPAARSDPNDAGISFFENLEKSLRTLAPFTFSRAVYVLRMSS